MTDGSNFGRIVHLAEGENADAWHSITEEEHADILRAQEESGFIPGTYDATEADYQNALESLGVVFDA